MRSLRQRFPGNSLSYSASKWIPGCIAAVAVFIASTLITHAADAPFFRQYGLGELDAAVQGAIVISKVVDGTPCYAAGVRPGDRLIAIDGFRVHELDEYAYIRQVKGDIHSRQLRMTLVRDDRLIERTVEDLGRYRTAGFDGDAQQRTFLHEAAALGIKVPTTVAPSLHRVSRRVALDLKQWADQTTGEDRDLSWLEGFITLHGQLVNQQWEAIQPLQQEIPVPAIARLAEFYLSIARRNAQGEQTPDPAAHGVEFDYYLFNYPWPRYIPPEMGDVQWSSPEIWERVVRFREDPWGILHPRIRKSIFQIPTHEDDPFLRDYLLRVEGAATAVMFRFSTVRFKDNFDMADAAARTVLIEKLRKRIEAHDANETLFQMALITPLVINAKTDEAIEAIEAIRQKSPYLSFVALNIGINTASEWRARSTGHHQVLAELLQFAHDHPQQVTPKPSRMLQHLAERSRWMHAIGPRCWNYCPGLDWSLYRPVVLAAPLRHKEPLAVELASLEQLIEAEDFAQHRQELIRRLEELAIPYATENDMRLLDRLARDGLAQGEIFESLVRMLRVSYLLSNQDQDAAVAASRLFVFKRLAERPGDPQSSYSVVWRQVNQLRQSESAQAKDQLLAAFHDHGTPAATVLIVAALREHGFQAEADRLRVLLLDYYRFMSYHSSFLHGAEFLRLNLIAPLAADREMHSFCDGVLIDDYLAHRSTAQPGKCGFLHLARCRLEQGRFEEAIEASRRSIKAPLEPIPTPFLFAGRVEADPEVYREWILQQLLADREFGPAIAMELGQAELIAAHPFLKEHLPSGIVPAAQRDPLAIDVDPFFPRVTIDQLSPKSPTTIVVGDPNPPWWFTSPTPPENPGPQRKSGAPRDGDRVLAIDGLRVYTQGEFDFIRQARGRISTETMTVIVARGDRLVETTVERLGIFRDAAFLMQIHGPTLPQLLLQLKTDIPQEYLASLLTISPRGALALQQWLAIDPENAKQTQWLAGFVKLHCQIVDQDWAAAKPPASPIPVPYLDQVAKLYLSIAARQDQGPGDPDPAAHRVDPDFFIHNYPFPRFTPLEMGEIRWTDEDYWKRLERQRDDPWGVGPEPPFPRIDRAADNLGRDYPNDYIRRVRWSLVDRARAANYPHQYNTQFRVRDGDARTKLIKTLSEKLKQRDKNETMYAIALIAPLTLDGRADLVIHGVELIRKQSPLLGFLALRIATAAARHRYNEDNNQTMYAVLQELQRYAREHPFPISTKPSESMKFLIARDRALLFNGPMTWDLAPGTYQAGLSGPYLAEAWHRKQPLATTLAKLDTRIARDDFAEHRDELLETLREASIPFLDLGDIERLHELGRDGRQSGRILQTLVEMMRGNYRYRYIHPILYEAVIDQIVLALLNEQPHLTDSGYAFVWKSLQTLDRSDPAQARSRLLEMMREHGKPAAAMLIAGELQRLGYRRDAGEIYDTLRDYYQHLEARLKFFSLQDAEAVHRQVLGQFTVAPDLALTTSLCLSLGRQRNPQTDVHALHLARCYVHLGRLRQAIDELWTSLQDAEQTTEHEGEVYLFDGRATTSAPDYRKWLLQQIVAHPEFNDQVKQRLDESDLANQVGELND